MNTLKVLILEDDLETLSKLLSLLDLIEKEQKGLDIAPTILSEYTQVEEYLNKVDTNKFDIILLDRDCKAGGSFHVLDLTKYPVDKIIGISSTPPYNEELRFKGVMRIVHKDYQNLDKFIEEVKKNIEELIKFIVL